MAYFKFKNELKWQIFGCLHSHIFLNIILCIYFNQRYAIHLVLKYKNYMVKEAQIFTL